LKTMTILGAFGVVHLSPLEVVQALTELRTSYTLVSRERNLKVHTSDGLCEAQPAWPIVIDSLKALNKVRGVPHDRHVYLIVDSRAALSHTNVDKTLWPESGTQAEFRTNLKKALRLAAKSTYEWRLVNSEPSITEYVNSATKPSFLNFIQTELYKITNYQLRKEVQGLTIAYLAGALPISVLRRRIKSSHKLTALGTYVLSDKAKQLKDAIAMLKTTSMEQVVKSTGFQQFELMYVTTSHAKSSLK